MNKHFDPVLFIEAHTTRCEASYRGGGIEIDVSALFNTPGAKITAYQNYLGGGLLGRICNSANFTPKKSQEKKFDSICLSLRQYFHNLTNHCGDEWEEETFEDNQFKPVSAY